MNIKSETNIHEVWDNVYYDRDGRSIDFYNETDTLCVYSVRPETIIQMFRNATCAGCGCTKLQDMDLPEHAKDFLREIAAVLSAWSITEAKKEEKERETAYEEDMEDMNRQGAETMAAAQL